MRTKSTPIITLLTIISLAAGCGSGEHLTAPAATPTVDTAPPAVPTGLWGTGEAEAVKLGWQRNVTDPDFSHFQVYRLAFGKSFLLNEGPLHQTTFVDSSPLPGHTRYGVSSVDGAGNESAWTEVLVIQDEDIPERREI